MLGIVAILSFGAAERFRLLALIAIGIATLCLLLVGAAQVLVGSVDTWSFERAIDPSPAVAGDRVTVTLRATALRWWAPSLVVVETTATEEHRLGFTRTNKRPTSEASWTTPVRHRGTLTSGPGQVWRFDTLGLFKRRCGGVPTASTIVRPVTVALKRSSLRKAYLDATHTHRERSEERGDLRAYRSGDDPRRVDWKASARATALGGALVVTGDNWRQPDDDVRVVIELDDLRPGGSGLVVPSSPDDARSPNRELALSVAASVLTAFNETTPCALEIRKAGRTLHVARSLTQNLDALAQVERLEAALDVVPRGRSGAELARQERIPTVVIAGPDGRGHGQLRIVCTTKLTNAAAYDAHTVLSTRLETLPRDLGEIS